jgi:hypothetical protein
MLAYLSLDINYRYRLNKVIISQTFFRENVPLSMLGRMYLLPRDVLEAVGPRGAVANKSGEPQHLRLKLGQQIRPTKQFLSRCVLLPLFFFPA